MRIFARKTVLTSLGIVLAGLIAENAPAQGTFGVTYDFSQVTSSSGTTDPTPPPTASGVTFGQFGAVGYTGSPNAGGRFSWQSNPLGGVNGSDDFSQFTGSLNPAAYYEVSLAPAVSFALQLDAISFAILRSSTGIRSYAVRSSLDGYAANLPASINPANANLGTGPGNEFRWLLEATTTVQNGSLVTPGAPFANLTSPVTFRFYGWNAEGSAGTFSLDNVAFSGSTKNVPEPSVVALLVLGLAACGALRLRARHSLCK